MKKLALALFALLALSASASAQNWPNPSNQVSIAGTVAASTRIITVPTGKQVIITALAQVPVATSVVTYTYGTGTNCGTGTGSLTGAMTFAAGQELAWGNGLGPIIIVPAGNDVCVTIATAAAPGTLVYTLFP